MNFNQEYVRNCYIDVLDLYLEYVLGPVTINMPSRVKLHLVTDEWRKELYQKIEVFFDMIKEGYIHYQDLADEMNLFYGFTSYDGLKDDFRDFMLSEVGFPESDWLYFPDVDHPIIFDELIFDELQHFGKNALHISIEICNIFMKHQAKWFDRVEKGIEKFQYVFATKHPESKLFERIIKPMMDEDIQKIDVIKP